MTALEVIAQTLQDARAAAQGGADSLEVCVDLAAEGLTPPLDLVRRIRDAVPIPLHVMLRPHNNGHVYSPAEVALMLEQVAQFKALGIQTIVFGAHTPAGALDLALIRQIAAAAAPLSLTVHRALDWSRDPEGALPGLIGVAARVLTSGPARSAPEGQAGLRRWVAQYGDRLQFVAGGGIRLENIRAIADFTGVHACHVGTAAQTGGAVDVEKVRALRAALEG